MSESTMPDEKLATIGQPSHGVEIAYETFGDPGGRPLLLVMGLGGPMTWWPIDLCRRLADAGFYVIRYDNRDTGHSTRFRDLRVRRTDLVRAFLGRRVVVPYSLRDLAADAFGLLDHLGLDAGHVAGISMGGMIAQTMAIEQPGRVLSLTSIMSSTGSRRVGWQDPKLLPHLLRRTTRAREAYVQGSVDFWRLIASPGFPGTDEEARERAQMTWERGVSLSGVMRQMLAVITQRDRTEALHHLDVPTSVVHGLSDRMVHVSGGRATARAIPGAELTIVPGMGHDTPPELFGTFADAITRAADRARTPGRHEGQVG